MEYTAEDFNKILQVNVTGVFSTAQAVAKEMVDRKTGGSICLIASMSGTIANRVINTSHGCNPLYELTLRTHKL